MKGKGKRRKKGRREGSDEAWLPSSSYSSSLDTCHCSPHIPRIVSSPFHSLLSSPLLYTRFFFSLLSFPLLSSRLYSPLLSHISSPLISPPSPHLGHLLSCLVSLLHIPLLICPTKLCSECSHLVSWFPPLRSI